MESRLTISDWIRIYVENRRDFYATVLPRIISPYLRKLLSDAVADSMDNDIRGDVHEPEIVPDEFVRQLGFRDILKKSGYGRALGRTTISWEEAISKAQSVEETGLLLFGTLAALSSANPEKFGAAAENHRRTLGSLMGVEDSVRYRKAKLQEDV